jgi:hypothetical protein
MLPWTFSFERMHNDGGVSTEQLDPGTKEDEVSK